MSSYLLCFVSQILLKYLAQKSCSCDITFNLLAVYRTASALYEIKTFVKDWKETLSPLGGPISVVFSNPGIFATPLQTEPCLQLGFLAFRFSLEKDSRLTQETHISHPFIWEIKDKKGHWYIAQEWKNNITSFFIIYLKWIRERQTSPVTERENGSVTSKLRFPFYFKERRRGSINILSPHLISLSFSPALWGGHTR